MVVEPRAQHVWVSLTGLWADDQLPGLLLGWRRTAHGWQGWVISVQPGIGAHQSGPYVRQGWVPATAIRPLTALARDGGGPSRP